MTRYTEHPMERNYREWDRAYKEKRNRYWGWLQLAWRDYQEADHGPYDEPNFASFRYYMENKYGLRVNMVGSDIDSSYQIIDDSKYTLFLMKYGNS